MKYIKWFEDIRMTDVSSVGGKNGSLGEMISQVQSQGIRVPAGFAIIADGYWHYLEHNKFIEKMQRLISQVTDNSDIVKLQKIGSQIRELILSGTMPDDLSHEIVQAYHELSERYKKSACDVAVRSSATAEDLPTASFAGQQDSFLNVNGDKQLLQSCQQCMASLFNDRAIIYRVEKGFDHFKVGLSIGIQKMIRSDKAVSGVAFSLDTETGFKDVVMIEASYGLGESIVQGTVSPDEYAVYKPTLAHNFMPIIKKICGDKKTQLIYDDSDGNRTKEVDVAPDKRIDFALTDDEIIELARYVVIIENYYSKIKRSWSPMDIEWAKDGDDGLLYIIQARPETVYGGKTVTHMTLYALKDSQKKQTVIASGLSIGQKIVSGVARIITSVHDISQVQKGDVVVTQMTDPDWVPIMKKAAGIITDRGGRTCHAAIVSRELGIPAIVGTKNGTKSIKNGDEITIDCSRGSQGYVYKGLIPFTVEHQEVKRDAQFDIKIMINCADPAQAFQNSFLPVAGIGLARIEFIISSVIRIHPMALLYPEKIQDKKVAQEIKDITAVYTDKKEFFIRNLAQGIGMIAAAFYPRPVIMRFSDFKTNEYRHLIGGIYFEQEEQNPMLGLRGASRYYDERYQKAFELECAALLYVRNIMGLKNVKVMVPFVRTVEEAQKVLMVMKENGLMRGIDDLEIIMMCEIPSNVLLIEQFCQLFDGFSIGSNDLTQLILGVDRDSEDVAHLFDETNEAVKIMMSMAIDGAHKHNKHIGICGQAPSDHPEIIEFLKNKKIDYISLNIDSPNLNDHFIHIQDSSMS